MNFLDFIEPPLNFTGSKFKLLGEILPNFDYSKRVFVDLFSGGGSVFSNVLNKYDEVIVNDILVDLINIHISLSKGSKIASDVMDIVPEKGDKEGFLKLRESYNRRPTETKLWALMLSSTNNMMRFNQKFKYNQTYGNRGWNDRTSKKTENYINRLKKYKHKLNFSGKPFQDVEIIKENSMVYIDPPYGRIKNENGGISKKQISEAGYNAFWKKGDDEKLYNYIHNIHNCGSSFCVSGILTKQNNTSWMLDKLIKDGFNYKFIDYDYEKVSRKKGQDVQEVIIKNY